MLVVNLLRFFIMETSGRWYEMALQLPVSVVVSCLNSKLVE